MSYFPTLALSDGLFTLMYMASNSLLLSMCCSLSMTLQAGYLVDDVFHVFFLVFIFGFDQNIFQCVAAFEECLYECVSDSFTGAFDVWYYNEIFAANLFLAVGALVAFAGFVGILVGSGPCGKTILFQNLTDMLHFFRSVILVYTDGFCSVV